MFTDRLYKDTPVALYNTITGVVFTAEDATEPITLVEAKGWCRVDVDDEDSIMADLIKAARQVCEDYANKSFINRTVTAVIVAPNGYIRLPYGPVKTMVNIKDEDNVLITEYKENASGIKVIAAKAFVTYTAGYTSLPAKFKIAILNQILFMYENRGDMQTISPAAKQSLKNVRAV